MKERSYNVKKISLFIMSLLYIIAGINHFIHPLFYKKIMPASIPWHMPLIFISGIAEIMLGIFLIPVLTRRVAAWGLIMLLIAIFPANINMMLNYLKEKNPAVWITILRLPLQFVLIWWAYIFTKKPA
ncbi:MAG TPA: hypothetical protein VMY77_04755 [Chitinophagaceae bacterium]|nr:hypothetical protein [Chitinophagaceae bacterium]